MIQINSKTVQENINLVTDPILIYWPLWQPVSLWPPKSPQNKAKRPKPKKK
jgi:hypothetical protein